MVGAADHASQPQLCARIYCNPMRRTTEEGEPFWASGEGNHEDAQRLALTDTTVAELTCAAVGRWPSSAFARPWLAPANHAELSLRKTWKHDPQLVANEQQASASAG